MTQPLRNKEEAWGSCRCLPRSPLPGLPPTYWMGKGWLLTVPSIPLLQRIAFFRKGAPTSPPEAAHEQGLGDTGSQRPAPHLSKTPLCTSQGLHGIRRKLT